MQLSRFNLGEVRELTLQLASNSAAPAVLVSKVIVQLRAGPDPHSALLGRGGDAVHARAERGEDRRLLNRILATPRAVLCWTMDINKQTGQLKLSCHLLGGTLDLGALDLGVNEAVLQKLKKNRKRPRRVTSEEKLRDYLMENCLLVDEAPGVGRQCFAILSTESGAPSSDGRFRIHGQGLRVDVKQVPNPDEEQGGEVHMVERLIFGKGKSNRRLFLARGQVRFHDLSAVGRTRTADTAELARMLNSDSDLMTRWAEYNRLEGQAVLEHAQAVGSLPYTSYQPVEGDLLRFDLEPGDKIAQRLGQLEMGDTLESHREPPEHLGLADLTWESYSELHKAREKERPGKGVASGFHGEVARLAPDGPYVYLKSPEEREHPPFACGVLSLGVHGTRSIMERRARAQEMLQNGTTPMPRLAMLLLGADLEPMPPGGVPALTPRVLEKLFSTHPPTERQERAIEMALNTPDLVLIQGPPGTGKTTVITAIVERLSEILDLELSISGEVLVSGYQHDAVENALERMTIFGLPAVKLGRRGRRDEANEDLGRIQRWCDARKERLRAKMPRRIPSELVREVSQLLTAYTKAPPDLDGTDRMLARVVELTRGQVSGHIADRLFELRRVLARARTGDQEEQRLRDSLTRMVRAVRVQQEAFSDDGADNALRAVRALEKARMLEHGEGVVLRKAGEWLMELDGNPDFLPELARVRHRLLLRLAPPPDRRGSRAQARMDVAEALTWVRDDLQQRHNASRKGPEAVAADYLYSLEHDHWAVHDALKHYSIVFGVTCQQAASRYAEVAKGRPGEAITYDTVLVDEAARATPLDLLIPLTQARRRIALVGDQRQLSHMLDRKLQRELEQAAGDDRDAAIRTRELLEKSLFQQLFNRLTAAGRTITLNKQFRMHPLLGDFVSREFYEDDQQRQLDERVVKSDLGEEHFVHDLPGYEGRPVAWIHVPHGARGEQAGTSKARSTEAKVLADELKRLMDSDSERRLSFGVITFYSRQVKELQRALIKLKVMRKGNDKQLEVVEPYDTLLDEHGHRTGQQRLRVGTVDAFQGAEFDVVFLSMVRSNRRPDDTEQARRLKYGHLMSPNRLCVSMSRQKRLLLVVGDEEMLRAPNAEAAVGPLVHFHSLCQEVARG